jgi:hypothetical protein
LGLVIGGDDPHRGRAAATRLRMAVEHFEDSLEEGSLVFNSRDINLDVDAIEQRSRDTRDVAVNHRRCTSPLAGRIIEMPRRQGCVTIMPLGAQCPTTSSSCLSQRNQHVRRPYPQTKAGSGAAPKGRGRAISGRQDNSLQLGDEPYHARSSNGAQDHQLPALCSLQSSLVL